MILIVRMMIGQDQFHKRHSLVQDVELLIVQEKEIKIALRSNTEIESLKDIKLDTAKTLKNSLN